MTEAGVMQKKCSDLVQGKKNANENSALSTFVRSRQGAKLIVHYYNLKL
jgi:hypothetical protein